MRFKNVLTKASVIVFLAVILLSASFSSAAIGTSQGFKTTSSGYGSVEIDVMYDGTVQISTTSFDLFNENLSLFQISQDSAVYIQLILLTVSIDTSDNSFSVTVAFPGNVVSNTTYTTLAQEARDKVKTFFGYTYSNEEFIPAYDDSSNSTMFTWTYTFDTSNIWSGINSIIDSQVNNPFKVFLSFNSSWTLDGFTYFFSKNEMSNGTGTLILSCNVYKEAVFSGNGTHVFNLQKILGYSEPPIGISYALSVTLPSGAKIDSSTLNSGNATIIDSTDESINLFVSSTETIGPLSFEFAYNFTAPSENTGGGENEPGSNPQSSESTSPGNSQSSFINNLLGGSSIYLVGGIAALAIIFAAVKSLLGKKE